MRYDPAEVAELYRLYRVTMEKAAERTAEEAALADIENRLWKWFPEIAAQKAKEKARVEGQAAVGGG
jgi:hypothetical protein